MDLDRRNLNATLLSRRLWADFRQRGYPAKVGVNVSDLREILDKQAGKCDNCKSTLLPGHCYATGIIRAATCKITCEKCHARP